MKEPIPIHLGSYLKKQSRIKKSLSNVQVYFLTGITQTRLSDINKPENSSLNAEEFYLIALAYEEDLDEMAEFIFKNYLLLDDPKAKEQVHSTPYDKYLHKVLMTQKDIADVTDISESRISTLRNDPTTVIQASEVYLTAKSLKRSITEAFEIICADIKLNTEEEQNHLKAIYNEELAIRKAKRDAKKAEKNATEEGLDKDYDEEE